MCAPLCAARSKTEKTSSTSASRGIVFKPSARFLLWRTGRKKRPLGNNTQKQEGGAAATGKEKNKIKASFLPSQAGLILPSYFSSCWLVAHAVLSLGKYSTPTSRFEAPFFRALFHHGTRGNKPKASPLLHTQILPLLAARGSYHTHRRQAWNIDE